MLLVRSSGEALFSVTIYLGHIESNGHLFLTSDSKIMWDYNGQSVAEILASYQGKPLGGPTVKI